MAECREVFLGCSVNVETQGKRRVLHNPSTHHILPVLHSIMLSSYLEDVKCRQTYKNIKSKHKLLYHCLLDETIFTVSSSFQLFQWLSLLRYVKNTSYNK